MLKKITTLSIAALILASGVASAKIINKTTGIEGTIYSAAIHNSTDDQWYPISLSGTFEETITSGPISADTLPVGHYDRIRYEHGPIKFKGYIEITGDQPQYNGIYTTVARDPSHPNDDRPRFKLTNNKNAAVLTEINITDRTLNQAEDNITREGVGSYKNGNNQVDMSTISLTISDVDGQHKASQSDIDVVLDKSYLWFGNGWEGVEGDNQPIDISFDPTTATDATLTLGNKATNPDNVNDKLYWKHNTLDNTTYISADSIDSPEIHLP